MKYHFLVTLLSLLALGVSARNLKEPSERNYCLSDDTKPYVYYGTKTAYDFIRQNGGSSTTCKPIQMWILSRHGTRFADEEDLEEMLLAKTLHTEIMKNYEKPVVGGLCDKDLAALRNWTWDEAIESQPDFLNEQGKKDLTQLAKRYQMRYPDLLGTYKEDEFYFRHSKTQRTEWSCKYFVDGLFGENAHENVKIEQPLDVDMVIRPFEHCRAWKEDVDLSDDRKAEKRVFRESAEYKKMQEDLSKRLGYTKVLKKDPIDAMYDNCRFDKSRFPEKLSPWCSVFSKQELTYMEYYSDLTRFYKSGYGHEYNPKLGCPPLKHLRETFQKTVAAGSAKPSVVGMFSHDTMIDMMFTSIGFAKDYKPLKGSDFQDLLIDRLYRTTFNTPFAANVVAVLHRCEEGTEEYKVQFFLNERPMEMTGCPGGLCDWTYLENFLSFAQECDLDFCDRL